MSSVVQLTPLLASTPYLLAYALPLLFISLLLTFSGTFLTLDRSRSFPPANSASVSGKGYASVPGSYASEKSSKRRFNWILEGGIGGLAGGYALGIHFATALALLIPATTNSAPLSPKSFLAIWVVTCIITTTLAGRYRYAAFLCFGISGGTLTALALCMITHPSLPSRIIIVAIFLPLFTVLLLLCAALPIPRLTNTMLHPFMRFCTASTGSFGIAASIALLLHPQEEGWANAWERLYMRNSSESSAPWGTSKEQGLSTGYAIFLVVGAAADWALRRWIGECPDEKWDSYLAQYAVNLPNQADRAGTFQPLTSIWDRFFSSTPKAPYSKEILFPSDFDMKSKSKQHLPLPITGKSERGSLELSGVPVSVELLKKKSKVRRGGTGWKLNAEAGERKERKPIKFGEVSDDSDNDSDDDLTKGAPSSSSPSDYFNKQRHAKRPGLKDTHHSTSASTTPTLVGAAQTPSDPRLDALETLDYDQEIAQLKKQRKQRLKDAQQTAELERSDIELDYSDYEEDLASRRLLNSKNINTRDRDPSGLIAWSPAFLQRRQSERAATAPQSAPNPNPAMPVPVPATPSLIKALDRLAIAQREAFDMAAAVGANAMGNQPHIHVSPTTAVSRSASIQGAPTHPKPNPRHTELGSPTPEDAEAAAGAGETTHERSPRWEEFWREVRVKAQT